jgi:aspartate carbamoyltransferase regulatory subunit
MRELKVDAIKDGTVIDHIPAGKVFQLIEILKITEADQIMIGTHLTSKKYGTKDIIKIENREFTPEELNLISLLAPTATFVTIRNFETISKDDVHLPSVIEKLLKCPNPTCITNNEPMTTLFQVQSADPISVRCNYCERVYTIDDINKFIYPAQPV